MRSSAKRVWSVLLGGLLALAGCGAPPAEAPANGPGSGSGATAARPAAAPWFVDVTAETGVDFRHQTGGTGALHLPEIMGAGLAVFDAEGDGDLDLYFVQGALELGAAPPGPRNRLFLQDGDGRFVDAPDAGLGDPGYGMGVAVGDVDNDGDPDVYVTNLGPDHLYRNRGDGSFEDATAAAGIAVGGWSTSASFLDYDRDGWLDLYVVRYVDYDPDNRCYDLAGRHEYCGPTAFPPARDVLLRNLGDGTFEDRSREAGIASVAAAGLGIACEDFDGDGLVDVYVANDAYPNQLWRNLGDGTFADEALILGASVNALGSAEAGMGVVAADFDNDLDVDLFLTHLADESNTLYRNLGAGAGFEDATMAAGLAVSSMPYTGFGVAAFDADLDGDLDLAAVNGRVLRGPLFDTALAPPWDDYAEPNLFYLGDGAGRFIEAGTEAAAFVAPVEISRGLATGDLDGDGDLDLVLSNTEGAGRVFRNDAPRRGRWLRVDAVDPRLGRRALGAVVTVTAGGRTQMRSVNGGFSYLSSSDPRVHFGLGEVDAVDRVVVRWPDGLREAFAPPPVDSVVTLVRGEGNPP